MPGGEVGDIEQTGGRANERSELAAQLSENAVPKYLYNPRYLWRPQVKTLAPLERQHENNATIMRIICSGDEVASTRNSESHVST